MGMFSWIKRKICKDPEPEKTDVATVVDGLVEKGFNRERAIATARYIIEKVSNSRTTRLWF